MRDCGTSSAHPHWSDLDGCDALQDDSDSEGSVAIEDEDVAFMRNSDDCSDDGSE